jgi:hypothetical protein
MLHVSDGLLLPNGGPAPSDATDGYADGGGTGGTVPGSNRPITVTLTK